MNKYSLQARIYPLIIFALPIFLVGVFYSIEYEKFIHLGTTTIFVGALVFLLANIGNKWGKAIEPLLWKEWGGMPTGQLLAYQDNHLDVHTKKRYHQKLLQLCPISIDINFENGDRAKIMEIYGAWTRYLLGKTRDTTKYELLFSENINYGFRRNLWGLKKGSLFLLVIILFANYFNHVIKLGTFFSSSLPTAFYISETLLFVLFLGWIFIINKSWIRISAFAYAERLLETVDSLTV